MLLPGTGASAGAKTIVSLISIDSRLVLTTANDEFEAGKHGLPASLQDRLWLPTSKKTNRTMVTPLEKSTTLPKVPPLICEDSTGIPCIATHPSPTLNLHPSKFCPPPSTTHATDTLCL
jgi:hypothetical protein